MKERVPKTAKQIEELETEIDELMEQEKHPAFKVNDRRSTAETPQPTVESEILSREAKIRELESVNVIDLKEEDVIESQSEPEINIKEEIQGSSEQTPKELKEKLRGLVGKFYEGAKEKLGMSERGKQLELNLEYRSKELDMKAGELGVEGWFRRQGEAYNKLNWKTKLGVGLALGVGAAAFSTVSVPLALACVSDLALQRVMGMSSMFMKFEKSKNFAKLTANVSEDRRKADAMAAAAMYSLGFGYGITKAVNWASDTELGHSAHDWLNSHWPFGQHAVVGAPKASATMSHETVAPPVHAPGMPNISIEAKTGHGYEWMMKRIWEQLQDKDIDASKFGENTDIHKLLDATQGTIDKVVHQIAADPQHEFFNPDGGTSVQINLDENMAIDTDGQIHMSNSADFVHAPPEAPVTPAYHPSMDSGQVPEAPAVPTAEVPDASSGLTQPDEAFTPPAETPTPPAETLVPATEQTPVPQTEQPHLPIESSPDVEVPTAIPETITNQIGVTIPLNEPHIYVDAGAKHIFAYGGSPAERADAILKYLTDYPDKIVYGTDDTGTYRIPWHLVEGKLTPGMPVRVGFWRSLFSGNSFMKAPEPEEFEKIIK